MYFIKLDTTASEAALNTAIARSFRQGVDDHGQPLRANRNLMKICGIGKHDDSQVDSFRASYSSGRFYAAFPDGIQ